MNAYTRGDRTAAISRALTHHGVAFSRIPEGRTRRAFVFTLPTSRGPEAATLDQAEWFCEGLALAERHARRPLVEAMPCAICGMPDDSTHDEAACREEYES